MPARIFCFTLCEFEGIIFMGELVAGGQWEAVPPFAG
jgi:hypothetical protein